MAEEAWFDDLRQSQRQGQCERFYDVWVAVHKKDGWVLTGNCACMAG